MTSATNRRIHGFARSHRNLTFKHPRLPRRAAKPATISADKTPSCHEHWTLQTSAKVEAKGEAISTPDLRPQRLARQSPFPPPLSPH